MIQGKNPTLLNVVYQKPDRKSGVEEAFIVTYKTEDGEVHYSEEPALASIFIVKPEYRDYNYNKPQERMELMDKITCPVSQIKYKIAEAIGPDGLAFVKHCYETKDIKALDRLYGWRFAYGCDFQPEFYFLRDWYSKYKLEKIKLTKSYIDIETDLMDFQPELDKLSGSAYAPINCVTVILEETNESYTFILRPYIPSKLSYKDLKEYEERFLLYENQLKQHSELMNNMDGFIQKIHDEFDSTYGVIDYKIREYEKEIDLIADIFRLINDRKPNFCMSWNMRFDIQYIHERIKVLGYTPESIICHKDFKYPRTYFKVDNSTYKIEKQFDYFYCDSYTQYICQMRNYASVRKSQQMLKSVSLNAIADKELKDKKIEYPAETNMMFFPYKDWLRFILYNIKDVLLQVGIENKVNDLITYYNRAHSNLTPYNKIFRETHLLRNVREMYFEQQGWVQSNNINAIGINKDNIFYEVDDSDNDEDEKITFKGAINADPIYNDNVGMEILGKPTNIMFKNAFDMDMGSFYPSNKISSNMDPSTLLFKALIDNQCFISGQYTNKSLNTNYEERDKNGNLRKNDITGEIVNTYVSGNILSFGYNYLNIPSITELYTELINTK